MTHSSTPSLLSVEDLRIEFPGPGGMAAVVSEVSFTVAPGEVLGIVGESGSGKSMTANAIMGLVDPPGRISAGRILFKGSDLLRLPPGDLRALRGNRIAMVFQDPMMTLNPVLRIDTQMIEAIRAHRPVSRKAARSQACEALERVGISTPDERLKSYPHQFSGGMRQRVAIAIALLNQPDLIICDEPTTALDVTIQSQILHQMQTLCREQGTALIWITHDLAVVAELAHRVAVMVGGRIVEDGPVDDVLFHPRHPYTRGLLASSPAHQPRGQSLFQIPGAPGPALAALPGCPFQPRCDRSDDTCRTMPGVDSNNGHTVRCFHPVDRNAFSGEGRR